MKSSVGTGQSLGLYRGQIPDDTISILTQVVLTQLSGVGTWLFPFYRGGS